LKFVLKNIETVYKSLFLLFLINISFSQTKINEEVKFIISDLTKVKNFNGVISSENVVKISEEYGLDNDQIMELFRPYSKIYSKAPISNYNVGAVCKGASGNLYFGSNIEILNESLSFTLHAEQAAIINAWNNGETEIRYINVGGSPCGHCLQFLNELNNADSLVIVNPKGQNFRISDLLTLAFGPKNLGVKSGLLSNQKNDLELDNDSQDKLVKRALLAAKNSYAPYSKSYSGLAVMTKDSRVFYGSYAENAAFNPSVSPVESTLSSLNLSKVPFDQIVRAVLVEMKSSKVSQKNVFESILKRVAPNAELEIVYCTDKK
jgi:cytidine deaminase